MENFNLSSATSLSRYIDNSFSDNKFGKQVITLDDIGDLEAYDAEFVIFGIPSIVHSENNFSLKSIKFESLLESLLNIQQNQFNTPEDLIVLGEIDLNIESLELGDQIENSAVNQQKVREAYNKLEDIILKLVSKIYNSGKIPIALGGNYKNSIDITKGICIDQNKTTNLLNFSPKTTSEYQSLDHLIETGNLRKHYSFGLHKNYSTQKQLDLMTSSKVMGYKPYEDCLHLTTLDKCVKFKNAIDFLNGSFGFSFDLHSIQNITPLAESASGFSMRDIRTFMKVVRKEKVDFFHISGFENCEENRIKSIISYLISDFIREED